MKTILSFIFIIIIGCTKNDTPVPSPLEQLPPATQIGANTVGCLINGEVFLPKESNPFGPPAVVCFYQYVDGQFHFSLGFSNDKTANSIKGINVASTNVELHQGQTYQLKLDNGNSAFANYANFETSSDYNTTNLITGELKITKLDQTKAIVSGTFWFDAINRVGAKVEIREGRFDMQYSQ